MMKSSLMLFSCWAAMCAPALFADIELYLVPDASADPYMILEGDYAMLAEMSEPVDSPQMAAGGWRFTEYGGTFTGYVEEASVGANSKVATGAVVHFAPDPASPEMTSIEEGDDVRLLYVGDWAQIEFNKRITLYYNTKGAASTAVVQESVPVTNPELAPISRTQSPDYVSTKNLGESDAALDADIDYSVPTDLDMNFNTAPSQPVVPTGGSMAQTEAPDIFERTKDYEGTLTITKKGVRKRSGYSLELRSLNGNKRIAFVDLENATVAPIEQYLDRIVIIHGKMRRAEFNEQQLVLRARTIRRP